MVWGLDLDLRNKKHGCLFEFSRHKPHVKLFVVNCLRKF